MDFASDYKLPGVRAIIGESAQSALASDVELSITGNDPLRRLDKLNLVHRQVVFIRMDKEPEKIRHAIGALCEPFPTRSLSIEPGSARRNAVC